MLTAFVINRHLCRVFVILSAVLLSISCHPDSCHPERSEGSA